MPRSEELEIYEEWVTYPDKRERAAYTDHMKQASKQGWFFSGWRGVGPDMQPLPELLERKFAREEDNDPAA